MAYMRLGDLLVSSGIITGEQLEQALALPREDGQRLGDVLIRQGVISEAQLIDALRVQLGVDFVDLTAVSIPVELAKYVPRNLAKKFLRGPGKAGAGPPVPGHAATPWTLWPRTRSRPPPANASSP